GEELGWRGFLFPRLLVRFGFNGACLIGGLIWAVWHYPGLIWGHYNAGTNPVFAVSCFTLSVLALSFISGWLRLRSGSIWPSVLLHASHNLIVQAIFDPMTADAGLARYATTEFGLGLTLSIGLAAWLVVKRRA
ncbi:MAG: CPBP family intramembrane glutamic endopeptidase, partial [Massilia sp.]